MGFAGTTKGSFFKCPEWVDQTKRPGHTPQSKVYPGSWARNYLTTAFFFYSPNFIWFVIAAVAYVLVPYDYEAGKTWAAGWVAARAALNVGLCFAYAGFWTVALYVWRWGTRKFKPDNTPTLGRMFHNVWYSLLGALHWTAWEVIFIHLYATGRLSFVTNAEILADPKEMVKFFLWILFVPMYRDIHFYMAHRFLHIRFLYKYVHSLHHRNTDIEPFSGLCMHPIEHLYYFSCVGPSLFIHASPFIFMWNGIHLLISPAASHSGFEDHFQSDQFHYLHHAKFECNYGTSGLPCDKLFGTFREKIGKSAEYHGEFAEDTKKTDGDDSALAAEKIEAPAFMRGGLTLSSALPSKDATGVYMCFTAALGLLLLAATLNWGGLGERSFGPVSAAHWVAFAISCGPLIFGYFLLAATGDKMSARWPFHKEPIIGTFGAHLVGGLLMTALPTYVTVYKLLA